MKKASANAATYHDAFCMVCAVVEASFDLPLQEVADLASVSDYVGTATAIVHHFKTRFQAMLPEERRRDVKFNETLLNCCAVALASEVFGNRLDKMEMLKHTSCSTQQYDMEMKQMRELTLKLLFPSSYGHVPENPVADEAEIIGGAPPRKKQSGVKERSNTASSSSARNSYSHDPVSDKPPRITLDMPISKDLEESIKKQDEEFVEKLMKTCLLSTPSSSMNSLPMAEKNRIDDEKYKEWRESIKGSNEAARVRGATTDPSSAPKKQTTIKFPSAKSSNQS